MEGNLNMAKCAVCGKAFTEKLRRAFIRNYALFGGEEDIEIVYRQCAIRLEKMADEKIKEVVADI